MQVPIEAPIEIKKKIAKKLQKNGALKKIERKIKLGMMVAVEEIKSEPKEKSKPHDRVCYILRCINADFLTG